MYVGSLSYGFIPLGFSFSISKMGRTPISMWWHCSEHHMKVHPKGFRNVPSPPFFCILLAFLFLSFLFPSVFDFVASFYTLPPWSFFFHCNHHHSIVMPNSITYLKMLCHLYNIQYVLDRCPLCEAPCHCVCVCVCVQPLEFFSRGR